MFCPVRSPTKWVRSPTAAFVRRCMKGATTVLHAATLHKPHVATHSRQDFIDVNITGTLNLLEEAAAAGVTAFVYTSTTACSAMRWCRRRASRRPGSPKTSRRCRKTSMASPRRPRRICASCSRAIIRCRAIVLRTSRFFPEEDDHRAVREAYADANIKANEFLYRRVDIEDVVSAHLLAARSRAIGRFREIHHQRHHAILARRRGGTAQRRAALLSAVTCRIMRPNIARRGWTMISGHRSRLRQRPGARRTWLAATP